MSCLLTSATKTVTVSFVTDTSAYASGDVVANPVKIPGAVLGHNGSSILRSVVLIDAADQGVALNLVFSKDSTVFGTLNAGPDISDANVVAKVLGHVPLATTDYLDLGGSRVATKQDLSLVLTADSDDAVYVGIVNGIGTPTFAADSLTLRLGLERFEFNES